MRIQAPDWVRITLWYEYSAFTVCVCVCVFVCLASGSTQPLCSHWLFHSVNMQRCCLLRASVLQWPWLRHMGQLSFFLFFNQSAVWGVTQTLVLAADIRWLLWGQVCWLYVYRCAEENRSRASEGRFWGLQTETGRREAATKLWSTNAWFILFHWSDMKLS